MFKTNPNNCQMLSVFLYAKVTAKSVIEGSIRKKRWSKGKKNQQKHIEHVVLFATFAKNVLDAETNNIAESGVCNRVFCHNT